MSNVIPTAINVLNFAIFLFILIISLKAHLSIKNNKLSHAKEMIRRSDKRTWGGRVYFYLLLAGCGIGMAWGAKPITYTFFVLAILTERLIVYRVCRGNKDRLGELLTRINW